jgi:hypothetical protein
MTHYYSYCPCCNIGLDESQNKKGYCNNCGECLDDDDYEDAEDYRDRMEEQRFEELAERAALCKCGAWQFAKNGEVVHVADCCCGAE